MTLPDRDREYTVVMVQNCTEAEQLGTTRLLEMLGPGAMATVACRECGREAFCSLDAWSLALPNPYPVCIGCLGTALAHFVNMDGLTITQGRELSSAYRAHLASLQ